MEDQLFKWLMERVTDVEEVEGVPYGIVEEGKTIPYKRMAGDLHVTERTIINWVKKLQHKQHVVMKRHQYGYDYKVCCPNIVLLQNKST